MATTVNWTRTGFIGITPDGWEIHHNRKVGARDWLVFNADGFLVGSYATRAEAVAVAR
jgi:hypothetical protein